MSTRDDHQDRLDARDEAALDALVEAGYDAHRVPAEHRERAAGVARVLALLDQVPADRDSASLADVTMARIARAGPTVVEPEPVLSLPDDFALESYVGAGYRADKVPLSLRERAERLDAMGRLLTRTLVPVTSMDLTSRTMSRIPVRAKRPAERFRFTLGGFRMADLVSVAAMLLIAGSVAWPMLAAARTRSAKLACASNMGAVATALGRYGQDYRGAMPVAAAGLGASSWWNVGKDASGSNSANLFTLAKSGYANLRSLACPGNAAAQNPCDLSRWDWPCLESVSYSYQIMRGPATPRWTGGEPMVVLADASPIIRRAATGRAWHPMLNSANHGGAGQWVLRNDGSAGWMGSPVYNGDNIWLPGVIEVALQRIDLQMRSGLTSGVVEIRGDEVPASASDSFLGP